MCSWHPVKTARRVRYQLQVDERNLDRGVSQPATQVVDLDAVHQQVAGVAVPYQEFMTSENGASKPLTEVEIEAPEMFDEAHGEKIVAVDWIRTVEFHDSVSELGFFGNQNTVARPRDEKWAFTVGRLKELWGVT